MNAEHLEKYGRVFGGIWYASAFKGAESPAAQLPPLSRHVLNQVRALHCTPHSCSISRLPARAIRAPPIRLLRTQVSWLEMHEKLERRAPDAARRVRGIVLTGWQRCALFATLCRLLSMASM